MSTGERGEGIKGRSGGGSRRGVGERRGGGWGELGLYFFCAIQILEFIFVDGEDQT